MNRKYRGDNSSIFSGAYYHHQARCSNGAQARPASKPTRAYIEESSTAGLGQGQIELVEKMLSQISMHQSATVVKPTRTRTVSTLAGTGEERVRSHNSFGGKKNNQTQHYNNSNYQGRFKSNHKLPSAVHLKESRYYSPSDNLLHPPVPSSSDGGDNNQCSQCEYVFVDDHLMPKFDCTHKAASMAPAVPSLKPAAQFVAESGGVMVNQASEANTTRFVTKTISKAFSNRLKKGNNHSCLNYPQQQNVSNVVTTIDSEARPNINPRQCIIPKNKCADIRKFVEAQIIFDRNIIDVVPVQADDPSPVQVKNKDVDQKAAKEMAVPFEWIMNLPKTEEEAVVVEQPILQRVLNEVVSDSECSVPVTIPTCDMSDTPTSSTSESSLRWAGHTVELSLSNSGLIGSQSSSGVQAQNVKKIRCLIANFITIQVEDDHSEESSHSEESIHTAGSTQEDILQLIDREKLGFQNFDGKNIGLYKNIGYINRNKAKFIRPTEELLQL